MINVNQQLAKLGVFGPGLRLTDSPQNKAKLSPQNQKFPLINSFRDSHNLIKNRNKDNKSFNFPLNQGNRQIIPHQLQSSSFLEQTNGQKQLLQASNFAAKQSSRAKAHQNLSFESVTTALLNQKQPDQSKITLYESSIGDRTSKNNISFRNQNSPTSLSRKVTNQQPSPKSLNSQPLPNIRTSKRDVNSINDRDSYSLDPNKFLLSMTSNYRSLQHRAEQVQHHYERMSKRFIEQQEEILRERPSPKNQGDSSPKKINFFQQQKTKREIQILIDEERKKQEEAEAKKRLMMKLSNNKQSMQRERILNLIEDSIKMTQPTNTNLKRNLNVVRKYMERYDEDILQQSQHYDNLVTQLNKQVGGHSYSLSQSVRH